MKLQYTPLDEARDIIKTRQADEDLQERLTTLTYGLEPGQGYSLGSEPALIYAEYVARPTVRDEVFALTALDANLRPVWATYRADTFTTTNKKKVSMWRPPLALPKGQNTRQWIVDRGEVGSQFSTGIGTVQTKYEGVQTVTDYWQQLRATVFLADPNLPLGNYIDSVTDLSDTYREWATANGEQGNSIAAGYYPAIMGMYATRAALYADFESYQAFKQSVAEPAYIRAAEILGVEPVIVRPEPVGLVQESRVTGNPVGIDQTDLTFLEPEQVDALLNTGVVMEAKNAS